MRKIRWELYKKFKFDHTTKWYMHKPEPVQANETLKFLWDFEIQADPLIPAWRQDLVMIEKKLPNSGLYRPSVPQSENPRKRKERQVLKPC